MLHLNQLNKAMKWQSKYRLKGFHFSSCIYQKLFCSALNMNLAEKFDNGVTDVDQNRNDQTLNSFRKKYEIH